MGCAGSKIKPDQAPRPTVGDYIEKTIGEHEGRCGTIIKDEGSDATPFQVKFQDGKIEIYVPVSFVRKIEAAEMERRQAEERAPYEQELRDAVDSGDAARLRKAIKAAKGRDGCTMADATLVASATKAWQEHPERGPTVGDCVELTSDEDRGRCGTITEERDYRREPFMVKLLIGEGWCAESEIRRIEPAEMERRQVEERAQAEQELRDAIASADVARLREAIRAAWGRADETLIEQAEVAKKEALAKGAEQELHDAIASGDEEQLRTVIRLSKRRARRQEFKDDPLMQQVHAALRTALGIDTALTAYMAHSRAALVSLESKETKDAAMEAEAPAVEVADAWLDLSGIQRPERHGVWFVVHNSLLAEIEYDELCDIHEVGRWIHIVAPTSCMHGPLEGRPRGREG